MLQKRGRATLVFCLMTLCLPNSAIAQEEPVVITTDQPASRNAISISIELTFGLSLNANRYRVNTGGGTFQDFSSRAGAGMYSDIRFVLDDLIVLNGGGASADSTTSIFGGLGFQTYQTHVDFIENVGGRFGGTRNLAYQGTTRLDSPFIFAGLNFRSDRLWNPFADRGGAISLGVSVGMPPTVTSQSGGGFRNESDETPFAIDAFYQFKVSDTVTIAPGLIVLLNANGVGDDTVAIGAIRTKFKF